MNRKDLFACPFFFDTVEFDDSKLVSAIMSTPIAGAMSYSIDVLDNQFSFLSDPINSITKNVMDQMGYDNYDIFTSWMTKTTSTFRHGFDHMHCNSFYSGVLYLTDKCSPILFRHPLPWRWSSGAQDRNNGVLASNQFAFTPKKGDIVMFPSHVHHIILPHHQEEARCSLAFNVIPVGKFGRHDSTVNLITVRES